MLIGIDASRAYENKRTGIEEYSYQVIKYLIPVLKNDQARLASTSGYLRESRRVILYVRKNQKVDFNLPDNWKIKVIKWPFLWTQIGLSLELFFHQADVLFVPAHVVPCIHPKNTIVTIHGLEYEFCPKAYSFWARLYMRWSIKKSCQWAKKVIAVSENTKRDLIKLYKVPEEKIEVIYEGVNDKSQIPNLNFQENFKFQISNSKYLLFIGRSEERKNICGIIKSFEILKEKYKIPHKLVLVGKPGYGYKISKFKIQSSKFRNDIILTGFASEEEKWELLKNADVFLFPTLYEGFGLPILEAQSVGVPVVASNNSSIPEVTDNSSLLVNPQNPSEITEAAHKLISDKNLRNDIINRGYENVKRFSWEKCADSIAKLLNA